MTENALHRLRPVDLDFLTDAPVKFTYEVELPAPVEAVFAAISADPSTWTWFPGLADGRYESPAPHGVGTKRAIALEGTAYRETMLAWDVPGRWAYRVDASTDTTFLALAEDWVMEPRGTGSILQWTFAVEPQPELAELIAGAGEMIGTVFANAMVSFSDHLRAATG
ncbi:MAG: SRPBCC family protein [Acidimicrobiia bacterium]